MSDFIPVAFDTETHLMGPQAVAPRLVCASLACRNEDGFDLGLFTQAPEDKAKLDKNIDLVFKDKSYLIIGQNIAYDLAVICNYRPDLFSDVFQALEESRIQDTRIREMLLNLADQGSLEFYNNPDGSTTKLSYSLDALVKKYLGLDISETKKGDDVWRLNYKSLDGVKLDDWPDDAIQYALSDAQHTYEVWEAQNERAKDLEEQIGRDPLKVQDFRVAVAFALQLMTCWGIAVDPVAKKELEDELAEALRPEKLDLLLKHKILVPAKPPRAYKNNPNKMTKGTPERIDSKKLKAHVQQLAMDNPKIELKRTAPSTRHPEGQISVDAAWVEENKDIDPVLQQYHHRQKLQKLVTTELPRMNWEGQTAPIVHPPYEPLKSTGRVSSKASKLFPSFNCQNVDPRARACYVPRDGQLFVSLDYSGMELGTLAQVCLNLFGKSILAEKIKEGADPHAYLGSQLIFNLDEDFRQVLEVEGIDDPELIYAAFMDLAAAEQAEKELYKHYRTFAKPTGLGYPGGLGPETFITFAKATYGIEVDLETAIELRNIWKRTYPEMNQYFNYVNKDCFDPRNEGKYAYESPFGMYRAGADYCACCNGLGLQTPSAEGALLATFQVVRACFDPAMGNELLYNKVRPILFIHDELVCELPDDHQAHDRVQEISAIMVESMATVTPDVPPKAEGALMRRWNKFAEPVYDKYGRLKVWEPQEN